MRYLVIVSCHAGWEATLLLAALAFLTLLQNVIREWFLWYLSDQNLDNGTFSDLQAHANRSPVMVFQVTSLLIRFPAAFMFFLSFASSHNTSGERGGISQVLIASSSCRTDIPFVVSGTGMIIFPACRASITSCFFIGSPLMRTLQLQASPGSFVSSSL